MRHLIVCCDGTWQTPDNRTNVHRLAQALEPTDPDGVPQVRQYFPGVGVAGSLWSRIAGGVAGTGLSRKVMEAYHWTATHYRDGDRVALFGFSRGAYTARSLGGMISACGLLDLSDTTDPEALDLVERVYRDKYRAGNAATPGWRRGLRFRFDPDDKAEIPIGFIGVWDTVGSLGIPDHIAFANVIDPPARYRFHDVTLNPFIAHARQAVALDEFRGPFAPTLWSEPAEEQDIRQVWFPGDHSDVGGGRPATGLSDGALLWMMREATDAVGLAFDKTTTDDIRPDPLADLGDGDTLPGPAGVIADALFQPRPRAVPLINPEEPADPSVHESAYLRQRSWAQDGRRYRATRRLDAGTSVSLEVSAREGWNETGLYLERGMHRLTAEGRWRSGAVRSGPDGVRGPRLLQPRALGQVLGTVIGHAEGLLRRLSGNRAAEFYGARREERLPWMSLVGVVANETPDAAPRRARPHEVIGIGAGVEHDVARPGYLYAFANDAWGFYRNNSGTVRLTVTRLR
ncbi:DUF2235 domain-containing protein [Geodermatophilus sp. YIM 151500]|uniref:DUF2235 domain-containing protein n=1 Tax=Geodermatophilus sp. YIM 151500 TaxID=2984531 RepID=UPI0021E39990|nr:DUF2235 domain-containing protein [Geodermatophilus sp. YIM 151500]MCV2489844.1 DUF2235 domain-containing protein [Geodermatophilus sp. YIM 151500]